MRRPEVSVVFPPSAPLPSATTFGLVFGTALAGHAVLEIPDCLPPVLGADAVGLVLLAAVAGAAAGIIADMAGGAGRVVIAVEHQKPRVIEGGGRPCRGGVALRASGGEAAMEVVRGCPMAGGATRLRRGLQQRVL